MEIKPQTGEVNGIYERRIAGAMKLDSKAVNDFDVKFVDDGGRVPANENEICITKHLYNCLNEYYKDVSYEAVKSATFNNNYKVVGIIDDESDFSKYTQETEGFEQMINWSEMESIYAYGFSNLVFVNESRFNELKEGQHNSSVYWYYRADGYGTSSLNQITKDKFEIYLEDYIKYKYNNGYFMELGYENLDAAIQAESAKVYNNGIIWKTGYTGRDLNLSGNDIIVSEEQMRSWFGTFNA